jgi:hypothetical protein
MDVFHVFYVLWTHVCVCMYVCVDYTYLYVCALVNVYCADTYAFCFYASCAQDADADLLSAR